MELWTLGAPWDSNEWVVATHPTPVSGHTLQTKWGNKQSLTLKYKHKVAWLADMNPKAETLAVGGHTPVPRDNE